MDPMGRDEQKCSVPLGTCEFCYASVIFPSPSRSFCARVSADILLPTFNLSILYYFVKNSWLGALNYSYVTCNPRISQPRLMTLRGGIFQLVSRALSLLPWSLRILHEWDDAFPGRSQVPSLWDRRKPLVSRLVGPQCSLKIFEVGPSPKTLIPQDSRLTCNQVCSVCFGGALRDNAMSLWWILKCYIHSYYWKSMQQTKCNIYPESRNYWTPRGVFLFCMAFSVFIHPVLGNNKWPDFKQGHGQFPLSPPARPSEVEREDGGAGAVDGQQK